MLSRFLAVAVVGGLAVVLALLAWPQVLGLQRVEVVAQAVSFRGATAALAGAAAVVLTALGLVLRRVRAIAGALALVLLAYALGVGALQVARGTGAPEVPREGDDDVTVLSWNTLGDSVPAADVARVANRTSADVIALPETTEPQARRIARILERRGRDFEVHAVTQDPALRARSTSLLISRSLGDYRVVSDVGDTTRVPSVVAEPAEGQNAPRIVAVHTLAPYGTDLSAWRADLAWVAERCDERNVILAGDFNATTDHFSGLGGSGAQLGGCRDGALATRNAAVGTWPSMMPALIGTPIDHVLATPNWRFTGLRVLGGEDDSGSDHRPVLARLAPA